MTEIPDDCPHCGSSWIGDPIPEKDRLAYGRTHFRRCIAIYDRYADRTVAYKCPDCDAVVHVVWGRDKAP